MLKYTIVEDFNDIMEFPNRHVIRDFYIDIAKNGKRKNLICSFRKDAYIPFENLRFLQQRIDDGKIYVIENQREEREISSIPSKNLIEKINAGDE